MFLIDIQGKSMSLCDPTSKLKLQQQQAVQGQQGTVQQKDSQLPNMMMGGNQIGNNGSQLGYQANGVIQNSNQGILTNSNMNQQVIQSSANKQKIKYNSPMGHQFKLSYSNKLEQLKQNQAQKYNQLYQIDPQLQQQQHNFQQSQYMQNIQLQQSLLMTSPQFKDQENFSQMFPSFNNYSGNTYTQYLNNHKQQNTIQIRENNLQNNFMSEQSPMSTPANQNSQFASNMIRNSNVIQKQNEQRFSQIQHTHQLFSQLIMQQQQQNQAQQVNPSSQTSLPQQITPQQPFCSMANYFQQQQQQQQQQQNNNNNQLAAQQSLMFASCENFAQRNTLYSCVGNPNNPYNHHLNNPYLQEKRYYKSSKLPKIRKENRLNSIAFSEVRPSSREKSARFQLTASINSIVNSNLNQNGGIIQNSETLIDGKGQNQSNLEKSNIFNSETTIQLGSKQISGTQSLSNQQSLTNISLTTKDSNQLSLTTSNQASKKIYENLNPFGDDEEEKLKCIRYFRYNLGQLLHILGKKENYFNNLNNKKLIKTYAIINQSLGQKHLNNLTKNTINIINKVKKIVATKGKYKYRER